MTEDDQSTPTHMDLSLRVYYATVSGGEYRVYFVPLKAKLSHHNYWGTVIGFLHLILVRFGKTVTKNSQ